MPESVDFQSVMAELTQFQNAAQKIHEGLRNAKHKEILGAALATLQNARADVEIEYPKAMNMIKETARNAMAEAQQGLANLNQTRAQAEQGRAVVEAAWQQASLPPAKPEVKVDPTLGHRLRTELLERFGPQSGTDDPGGSKIREAWQDWD